MTDPSRYPGAPRWVKVLGVIAIVLLLLLVILTLTRGPGDRGHGPGLHSSGDLSGSGPAESGLEAS